MLTLVLAGSLYLTIVTYYLGHDAQMGYFPTYLAGIAFVLAAGFPSAREGWFSDPVATVTALLCLYLAFSTFWGESGAAPVQLGHALLLFGFVFGIPMVAVRHGWFLRWLCVLIALSAAVSASYSIWCHWTLGYHPLDEKDRLYAMGRLGNPVESALSYGAALVVTAGMMVSRPALVEKGLWLAIAALLAYTLLLTGTRGVWPGLLAAILAMALSRHSLTLQTRAGIALVIVAMTGIGAWVALTSDYRDELLRRSTSFRPQIWEAAWHRTIEGNWLLGHGNNTDSGVDWHMLHFDHPHSIYLATLFYGGVVGLALLGTLIAFTVRRLSIVSDSESRVTAIALLAFSVVALCVDGNRLLTKIDYSWLTFWLAIALALTVLPRRRQAP